MSKLVTVYDKNGRSMKVSADSAAARGESKNWSPTGKTNPSATGGDSNRVIVTNPQGRKTTAIASSADRLASKGWDIGESVISTRNVDKAIRNTTAGSNWVDDGKNNGFVQMITPQGRTASVNARSVDKYFDQGYTMSDKSQSIERALQADYHKANDAANAAIRDGTYNPNTDYKAQVANQQQASSLYSESVNRALANITNQYNNMYDGVTSQYNNMYDGINSQLEELMRVAQDNNDVEMLQRILEESQRVGYNLNLPENYQYGTTPNTNIVGGSAVSRLSDSSNPQTIPGQVFVGNDGKKYINENGQGRAMTDEEVVKHFSRMYGF